VLPGFGLSLGFTVTYLGLIVLFPLLMVFVKTSGMGWKGFWAAILTDRVLAACKLTFGLSLLAGLLNGFLDCSSPGCCAGTAFPAAGFWTLPWIFPLRCRRPWRALH
jgi:ABC-type sulfate transport system permease subunit